MLYICDRAGECESQDEFDCRHSKPHKMTFPCDKQEMCDDKFMVRCIPSRIDFGIEDMFEV